MFPQVVQLYPPLYQGTVNLFDFDLDPARMLVYGSDYSPYRVNVTIPTSEGL